jgi:hypothetical protein
VYSVNAAPSLTCAWIPSCRERTPANRSASDPFAPESQSLIFDSKVFICYFLPWSSPRRYNMTAGILKKLGPDPNSNVSSMMEIRTWPKLRWAAPPPSNGSCSRISINRKFIRKIIVATKVSQKKDHGTDHADLVNPAQINPCTSDSGCRNLSAREGITAS